MKKIALLIFLCLITSSVFALEKPLKKPADIEGADSYTQTVGPFIKTLPVTGTSTTNMAVGVGTVADTGTTFAAYTHGSGIVSLCSDNATGASMACGVFITEFNYNAGHSSDWGTGLFSEVLWTDGNLDDSSATTTNPMSGVRARVRTSSSLSASAHTAEALSAFRGDIVIDNIGTGSIADLSFMRFITPTINKASTVTSFTGIKIPKITGAAQNYGITLDSDNDGGNIVFGPNGENSIRHGSHTNLTELLGDGILIADNGALGAETLDNTGDFSAVWVANATGDGWTLDATDATYAHGTGAGTILQDNADLNGDTDATYYLFTYTISGLVDPDASMSLTIPSTNGFPASAVTLNLTNGTHNIIFLSGTVAGVGTADFILSVTGSGASDTFNIDNVSLKRLAGSAGSSTPTLAIAGTSNNAILVKDGSGISNLQLDNNNGNFILTSLSSKIYTSGAAAFTVKASAITDALLTVDTTNNDVEIGTVQDASDWYLRPDVLPDNDAPAAADCNAAGEVGRIILEGDFTNAQRRIYVCTEEASGVYDWWYVNLADLNP